MKAGTYYVLSALVFLATLPMYRYIFRRESELRRERPAAHATLVRISPLQPPPLYSPPSHRVRLFKGAICSGGFVYSVEGNAYTSLTGPDGRPARCEGRYLLP